MSSTKPDKLFALVDCDNFYVSCERLFQPQFRNRPVVVLSNNDGVIVARSPEVKALGIEMAKPFHQFKDTIEKYNVKVFSSNYTLYGDISRRVMETLREAGTDVDVYSIDEAFLSFSSKNPRKLGEYIREQVKKNIGVPVSIGIGTTKTLAKIATEYAKSIATDKPVFDLSTYPEPDGILSSTLVQNVWGIGVRLADWLYRRKIITALDLKNINDQAIKKKAGVSGLRVVYELRGVSCIALRSIYAPRKRILSSRSFGRYVTSLEELEESVATHATIAAEKLRTDGSVAGKISAFITTNVYSDNPQYGKSLEVSIYPSSNSTHKLVKLALSALRKIYKDGYRYIKAGVALDKLSPESERQIDLFVSPDMVKEKRMYQAVDSINLDFGSHTIHPLSCGIRKTWKMKQDFNSRRFTTKWEEIPVAEV